MTYVVQIAICVRDGEELDATLADLERQGWESVGDAVKVARARVDRGRAMDGKIDSATGRVGKGIILAVIRAPEAALRTYADTSLDERTVEDPDPIC